MPENTTRNGRETDFPAQTPAGPDSGHELTRVEARYAESDRMGYVHHAVYPVWFELGRVQWLRRRGCSYRALEDEGARLPVAAMSFRFRGPGHFEDQVVIESWPVKVGRARLTFHNRAWRLNEEGGGEEGKNKYTLLAEAVIELACVDAAGRVRRLPETLCKTAGGE